MAGCPNKLHIRRGEVDCSALVPTSRVLAGSGGETVLIGNVTIPIMSSQKSTLYVVNVLAAVGAAWALDIPLKLIRVGVEAFDRRFKARTAK